MPLQSNGEHDFDIVDEGGRKVGVLEVTIAANHAYLSMMSEVFSAKNGRGTVESNLCSASWCVTVAQDARIKRIRQQLDRYLADVERAGLTTFDRGMVHPAVRAVCRDLAIHRGYVVTDCGPGHHFVTPPAMTGWTDSDAITAVVRAEATKPDNARKLSNPAAGERHLFVYIDISSIGAHFALESGQCPAPVFVDTGLTHVWAGAPQQGHVAAVWHAENGGSWTRHVISMKDAPEAWGVT